MQVPDHTCNSLGRLVRGFGGYLPKDSSKGVRSKPALKVEARGHCFCTSGLHKALKPIQVDLVCFLGLQVVRVFVYNLQTKVHVRNSPENEQVCYKFELSTLIRMDITI